MISTWDEATKLVTINIHKKLKSKINASIHVSIDDNVLCVRIQKDNLTFGTSVKNMDRQILHGYVDEVIDEVLCQYRRFVIKQYFY